MWICMKKIKRMFLIVFSVILMCGIFQQLYYRIEYEGNLVFYLWQIQLN